MLKVGTVFKCISDLAIAVDKFQATDQVQLWIRDSRTIAAAAKRARRKTLNPKLQYAELTYSCVFGGRRPSDQSKAHNQTSASGCPFKVRISTSSDGQALVIKEVRDEHNHDKGKKLHDEPRKLYRRNNTSRALRHRIDAAAASEATNGGSSSTVSTTSEHSGSPLFTNKSNEKPIKLIVAKSRLNGSNQSTFANLHQLQQTPTLNNHPLKVQLAPNPTLQPCMVKSEGGNQFLHVANGFTPENSPDHSCHHDFKPSTAHYYTPSSSNSPLYFGSAGSSPTTCSGDSDFTLPMSPISPLAAVHTPNSSADEANSPLHGLDEFLAEGLTALPDFCIQEEPSLFLSNTKQSSKPKKVLKRISTTLSNSRSTGTFSRPVQKVVSTPVLNQATASSLPTTSHPINVRTNSGAILTGYVTNDIIKVGFPTDNGNIAISNMYRASSKDGNSQFIINPNDPNYLKTFKQLPTQQSGNNMLYSVLCGSKVGNATTNYVQPKLENKSYGNVNPVKISGSNRSTTTRSSEGDFVQIVQAGGPIKNYRTRIAKQPYTIKSKVITNEIPTTIVNKPTPNVVTPHQNSTNCYADVKTDLINLKQEPIEVKQEPIEMKHEMMNIKTEPNYMNYSLSDEKLAALEQTNEPEEMDRIISGGIDSLDSKTDLLDDMETDSSNLLGMDFLGLATGPELDSLMNNLPTMDEEIHRLCTSGLPPIKDEFSTDNLATQEDVELIFGGFSRDIPELPSVPQQFQVEAEDWTRM